MPQSETLSLGSRAIGVEEDLLDRSALPSEVKFMKILLQ